jgi:hypothetical protein
MKFLIYQTKEEAEQRADVEGQALNLPYWQNPEVNISRRTTEPLYTNDGEWGLEVSEYTTLTEEEESQAVEELNLQSIE